MHCMAVHKTNPRPETETLLYLQDRDETETFGFYRATAKHTHGISIDICLSVRPSVRLPVCLSNACIVTKLDNGELSSSGRVPTARQ